MTDREIRTKALELTVQIFALLPQEGRNTLMSMSGSNKSIQQYIIDASQIIEEHIKTPQT